MNKFEFSKIDGALLLAMITGITYTLAFVYESSYLSYYKLPDYFIDLNLTILTRSLFSTIVVVGGIMFLAFTLTSLITKDTSSPFSYIPVYGVIFVILILIFGAYVLGKYNSTNKEEYLVIEENHKHYVVITSFKDNVVISPVNLEDKTIYTRFTLKELKTIKDSEMIKFKGGLKVKKQKI